MAVLVGVEVVVKVAVIVGVFVAGRVGVVVGVGVGGTSPAWHVTIALVCAESELAPRQLPHCLPGAPWMFLSGTETTILPKLKL